MLTSWVSGSWALGAAYCSDIIITLLVIIAHTLQPDHHGRRFGKMEMEDGKNYIPPSSGAIWPRHLKCAAAGPAGPFTCFLSSLCFFPLFLFYFNLYISENCSKFEICSFLKIVHNSKFVQIWNLFIFKIVHFWKLFKFEICSFSKSVLVRFFFFKFEICSKSKIVYFYHFWKLYKFEICSFSKIVQLPKLFIFYIC